MIAVIHPLVHVDIAETMEFYEREGGSSLAADFFGEYEIVLDSVKQRPHSFVISTQILRRANFDRFRFIYSSILSRLTSSFWSPATTDDTQSSDWIDRE